MEPKYQIEYYVFGTPEKHESPYIGITHPSYLRVMRFRMRVLKRTLTRLIQCLF